MVRPPATSTPRARRSSPRLCVHVSPALVVRILDASRHQHLDGDRHPDRVLDTVATQGLRPGQRFRPRVYKRLLPIESHQDVAVDTWSESALLCGRRGAVAADRQGATVAPMTQPDPNT